MILLTASSDKNQQHCNIILNIFKWTRLFTGADLKKTASSYCWTMAVHCQRPWRTLGAVSFSDSGSVWLRTPELLLWHEAPHSRADRASLILQSSVCSFTALATRTHFHLVLRLHETVCHAESFMVLLTGEPKSRGCRGGAVRSHRCRLSAATGRFCFALCLF